MSKTYDIKCSNFFLIAFAVLLIRFCTSAPVVVTDNAYTQFIVELNGEKCSLPSQVRLPFDSTKANNFEYLMPYLKICQNAESTKRNKEAVVLCKEIFDNIRSISCPMKTDLPDISVNLSNNVCEDISAVKNSVPEDDRSLLKRLTDSFLCDIMCDKEFEKACQILLWSFKVQKRIASVLSAQEFELSSFSEDEGNMNVDSLNQDGIVNRNVRPEISVDLENGEKYTDNVNKVIGNDGISVVSKPSNPEQKLNIFAVPTEKEKIEKSTTNDKEAILENRAVPEAINNDSSGSSKFTSSTKTPDTVTQQKPGAEALNSTNEMNPVLLEIAKGKSDGPNMNNQFQSNLTKYDKVHAEGELLQDFNTNVATNEQIQGVNANALADRVVKNKIDTTLLANRDMQENSNNPTNQKIPVDGEDNPGSEVPEKDLNSNVFKNNDLSHESANKKRPNDIAAGLDYKQNLSNFVSTFEENKLQKIASNDDDLAMKSNSTIADNQAVKNAAQQQTAQESTQNKTSIYNDKTKIDQPETGSVLRKIDDTQDQTKLPVITHDLISNDKTKNQSTNKKKTQIAQQTAEFDNTILDTTETIIISDKESPEKSQKLKPTAVYLVGKSVLPNSLKETSTKTTVVIEKMEGRIDIHQPDDEEADHYEDPENIAGDDYMGPDHGEGGFGEVSKQKDSNPDVPSSITTAKEIITSLNEKPMEFPFRNAFGQDSGDIQMVSSFPEQEDGHFLFYFLSLVLIIMAGYLIFHNKQKIIALIVEGRHERNRRSHRIGYKKLETK